MARAGDDIATAPIDLAIARIRAVYRSWNRDTSVAQMRSDWDVAFGGSTAPVICEPVSAGGVDGEWISPAEAPEDKAILYFHGGGFRIGSVASHRDLIAQIALACGCRVLAINYRLAPEHRFPAALDDALAAYCWMLDRGLKTGNVAFAGDFVGGNLVLPPCWPCANAPSAACIGGALVAMDDLAATGASYVTRAERIRIHQRSMILALARNYLGGQGDPRHPLVSPLYADLRGLPPLLIQVGDRETVLDDSVVFADKARAAVVDVDLQVWDGMIHVFQMFGAELAEAHRAIASIGGFLEPAPSNQGREGIIMNVRPADPRSHADSEFHFSEQPQLPEELRMLREQVRRFVEKEVVPHGEQWERDGKIPRAIYRRMGELGLLGMRHPEDSAAPTWGRSRRWCGRRNSAARPSAGLPRRCWCIPTCRRPHHAARHGRAEGEVSSGDHPRRDHLRRSR